ncbi:hypothetical protein DV736_g5085, partial [Chaetothyriales sp. CBS 134916]
MSQPADTPIEWGNWAPPGEGDVRSPCPAVNALANHHLLPHNGKGITKDMVKDALTNPQIIHLSPLIASVFATGAIAANPDHGAHTFDLNQVDKHGYIEHDVSLSRNDYDLGDNASFDQDKWATMFKIYGEENGSTVAYEYASKARYSRVRESKEAHEQAKKPFRYGIKEGILSYGETALWVNLLGKDGVVPLEHLRIFFEEERFPYAEGWRPPAETITQQKMNKTMLKLVAANKHKGEEAVQLVVGTFQAIVAAALQLPQRRPPPQRQDQYDQYDQYDKYNKYDKYGSQQDGYYPKGYHGHDDQGYDQHGHYQDQQHRQHQQYGHHEDDNYQEPLAQHPSPGGTYQYDERYRPNSLQRPQPMNGPLPQEMQEETGKSRQLHPQEQRQKALRERILQEPASPKTLAWDNPFGVFPPVQKTAKAHGRHVSLDKERPEDFRLNTLQGQSADTLPLTSPELSSNNMPLRKRVLGPSGPPQANASSREPEAALPLRPLPHRSNTQPTPSVQSSPFQPSGDPDGYDYNQHNGYGHNQPQPAPIQHRAPVVKYPADVPYKGAPPPESYNLDAYRGVQLRKPLSHPNLEPPSFNPASSQSREHHDANPTLDTNLSGLGQTAPAQMTAYPQPSYSKPTYQVHSTSVLVDTRDSPPPLSEPKTSSPLAEFSFDLPPSNTGAPPAMKSPPPSQQQFIPLDTNCTRKLISMINNADMIVVCMRLPNTPQAFNKVSLLRVNFHREAQVDQVRSIDLPVMSKLIRYLAREGIERVLAKYPIDHPPTRMQEGVPMDHRGHYFAEGDPYSSRQIGHEYDQSAAVRKPLQENYGQPAPRSHTADARHPPPMRSFGERTSLDHVRPSVPPAVSGGSGDRPVPYRPGLAAANGRANVSAPATVAAPTATPVAMPRSQPQPNQRAQSAPPPEGDRGAPVTVAELNGLRESFKNNPNDWGLGLRFAQRLVEAASVLSSENGRADQKTTAKNRERYIFDAHKILKKLVTAGSPEAMFYLADCYGQGQLGLAPDPKEAFTLYQSAAKLNHAQSAYRVAVCCELGLEEGGGTRRDAIKAMQWYKRAATLGDAPAMYKLGMIMLKGLLGQHKNSREAVTWLKRAADRADAENPHALHELGLLYESAAPNDSIIRDERYAFSLFQQAADLGYKYSQFRLGSAWEYGLLGCPIDARQSITWYTRAAAQEEHQSELALSGWYLTGCEPLLQQSDREAYLWAQKAASSGLAKAEYAMGYFTEVGIGTAPNVEEAKRWYYRAAVVQNEIVKNHAL